VAALDRKRMGSRRHYSCGSGADACTTDASSHACTTSNADADACTTTNACAFVDRDRDDHDAALGREQQN